MRLGLSTYSYFWQIAKDNPHALSLEDLIKKTSDYGLDLLQICDYPALDTYSEKQLLDISKSAKSYGITLEVGTRGISPSKLTRYVRICELLESKMLRTMLNDASFIPTRQQAIEILKDTAPRFEKLGIQLALETYEQRKTMELIEIIDSVDSPNLGICLDPANCIANLELPEEVMKLSAPYVYNLHLKDFTFSRKNGWVGFSLIGTPLGDGQLDLSFMKEILKKHHREPNAILEFWLPFQDSMEKTVQLEKEWIRKSIEHFHRVFSSNGRISTK